MIPQIKYSDFPTICRLCMHQGIFVNLLERPDLIYVYVTITNNSIKDNDYFPKNVCHTCVQKLEIVRDFINICKSSYDYLTAVILNQDEKKVIFPNIIKETEDISTHNACGLQETTEYDDETSGFDQDNILEDLNSTIETETNNVKPMRKNTNRECKKCKKIFHSANSFKIHMKNCSKITINSKHNLKSQYSSDSTKNLSENVKLNEMLCNQIKLKKGVKKWKCFECNKEFTKKNDLQRHLRIHTGSRPFACSICDLKFTQKSTLNRHIGAIHIMDQKEKYIFECYICEKKFNRKDHLESHMINCHIRKINEDSIDNPDFKACKECEKSFSLFSYIKHHSSVHGTKEGRGLKTKRSRSKSQSSSSNLCSVCGKSFEKRATYLQHMRRSHGPPIPKKTKEMRSEKKLDGSHQRFQCWQCGKIKSTLCNLKVHMRMHTGEKPYQCKFCFRKFSAWNSWHDHENIHLGLKPYQCDYCKKVFRQRSSLRKHLRSSLHANQNKISDENSY